MTVLETLLMAVEHPQPSTGLHDGALEQAAVQRRADLRQHAAGPGGLPEDGDVLRVTAERGDVLDHPSDAGSLVQETEVRVGLIIMPGLGLLAQAVVRQESEPLSR